MGIFLYNNNQPAGVSQSYQRMSGLEITGFQSGIKVYGGDGGAEAGMTGWTSNQVVSVADADATHARSGSRLFKLAPVAAGGNALMYQAVQRLGTGSYQASACFSGTGGGSSNGWAIYDLSWKPLAANWSLPGNMLAAQQSVLNFNLLGTGSQTGFYVYYQFRSSAEGAYRWIDDITVIKKIAACTWACA